MLSDRQNAMAANSLITVTRSCGICTRFPFTLFYVLLKAHERHLCFHSVFAVQYSTGNAKKQDNPPFFALHANLPET
jgi:hypothetical protein